MLKLFRESSPLICATFCWGLVAYPQGVHLTTGNSLSIEFNGVDPCQFIEFAQSSAFVGFGNDPLGPGEVLRLELFENTVNDSPFASQTYMPATPTTSASLAGPAGRWLDYQGLVQVSMLSGSVDVIGTYFFIAPDQNTLCTARVTVPEPTTTVLLALGGLSLVIWRRSRSRFRAILSSMQGEE